MCAMECSARHVFNIFEKLLVSICMEASIISLYYIKFVLGLFYWTISMFQFHRNDINMRVLFIYNKPFTDSIDFVSC